MKKYESRTRDKILGKLSSAINRQKSDQKSLSSSSTASTTLRRVGIENRSRSRSQSRSQSRSFLLGAENLSENRLNDKNFKRFHWSWKLRRALIIEDCRTAIRSDALHFKYNLASVEFVGITSCINLRILLTTCPHIRRLIFNNVTLTFLSTDSRFSIITLNNLQEIKFFSSFPKISQHEYHLLDWFYKRVRMLSLQAISFEPRSYFTKDSVLVNSTNNSTSNSNSKNGAVSTTSNYLRNSSASDSPSSHNPNMANKRQAFVLSNLLLKYAETLKSLEVRRGSSIFIFDESKERLSKIAKLQLERFSSDMRNEGFDKILSVQKSIQAIHCYYNGNVNVNSNTNSSPSANSNINFSGQNPKGFKRLFATIASNVKHIKEIVLVKQQAGKESETGLNSHPSQFNNLIPELVNHDFKMYEKCVNLTKLNIDVSTHNSNSNSHVSPSFVKRPTSSSLTSATSTVQHHLGLMEFKTGIRNLDCIPISIRSLILRFDFISDGQMEQFAHHFPQLVNLMFFVMHGNPDRPFKLTLDWISHLIELDNLMLFEFHFCDFKDMDRVSTFTRARPSLYYSKFEASKESVVYWRTKSSSDDSHLNHTNTNPNTTAHHIL